MARSTAPVKSKAGVQMCTIHLQRNLSKSVRTKDRAVFCQDLKTVFQSDPTDSVRDGLRKFSEFCGKWKNKYPWLSSKLQNERLALHFTYLKYNYNIPSTQIPFLQAESYSRVGSSTQNSSLE